MTIEQWLKLAKQRIPALDAELILLYGLRKALPPGVDRSYLFTHPTVGMSQSKWEELDAMAARRVEGEPLAYILGQKEFYGREFTASPAVLIPRPETEQLVEMALVVLDGVRKNEVLSEQGLDGNNPDWALQAKKRPKVLEIGTGSGCIAVTLKLERPEIEVLATDISPEALEVARVNAERLGAGISFLESDLLAKVPEKGDFDLIIANLPYVSRDWGWVNQENLRFEPELALYAGKNGLALYHGFFRQMRQLEPLEGVSGQNGGFESPESLRQGLPQRQIIVEVDPCQQAELIAIAEKMGFQHLETRGFGVRFSG